VISLLDVGVVVVGKIIDPLVSKVIIGKLAALLALRGLECVITASFKAEFVHGK
jgi:hypothetical protein